MPPGRGRTTSQNELDFPSAEELARAAVSEDRGHSYRTQANIQNMKTPFSPPQSHVADIVAQVHRLPLIFWRSI